MGGKAKERNQVDRLRVRVRRTLSGEGSATTELSVFCPLRGVTLSLEECTACDRCDGLLVDSSGEHAFLRCRCAPAPDDEVLLGAPDNDCGALAGQTPIAEVMTADVICVQEDLSVVELTAVFIEKNISGAPVVDAAGKPIGVVSKTDLLREHIAEDEQEESSDAPLTLHRAGYEVELGPGFHAERIARSTVGEIMMPIAFTLPESAPISRAAGLMALEGVHRIPVVSDEGKVVGIVSALDILRWLARQDGYLLSPNR